MESSSKAVIYGGISLGLIYVIGFIITLFSQNILKNLEFNPTALIVLMIMLFFYKLAPFILFLILTYIICKYLVQRLSISFALLIPIIIILFLVFGRIVWHGEFLHMYQFDRPNYTFRRWWASETRDWHFSIASFISTFFFVWMTFYRTDKTINGNSELVKNNSNNI